MPLLTPSLDADGSVCLAVADLSTAGWTRVDIDALLWDPACLNGYREPIFTKAATS